MPYAYVVTRITRNNNPGIIEVPNLGVHRNHTKGMKHFASVLEERKKKNPVISEHYFDNKVISYGNDKFSVIRVAYIDYSNCSDKECELEELRLEKWKI